MVLKQAPEIYGQHLTREIGSAQDYCKNKERGEFAESYDLRIPKADDINGINDDDIAGALDDMNRLSINPEEKK